MTRVRLSLDIDPDLKRRVKLAAVGNDQSIREWVENALLEALEREEDHGWMESDLSRLGEIEPYEFEEGDLEKGDPVRFVPGRGYVVVVESDESDDNIDE